MPRVSCQLQKFLDLLDVDWNYSCDLVYFYFSPNSASLIGTSSEWQLALFGAASSEFHPNCKLCILCTSNLSSHTRGTELASRMQCNSLRKVSLQQSTSVVNASVQGSLQVCK